MLSKIYFEIFRNWKSFACVHMYRDIHTFKCTQRYIKGIQLVGQVCLIVDGGCLCYNERRVILAL